MEVLRDSRTELESFPFNETIEIARSHVSVFTHSRFRFLNAERKNGQIKINFELSLRCGATEGMRFTSANIHLNLAYDGLDTIPTICATSSSSPYDTLGRVEGRVEIDGGDVDWELTEAPMMFYGLRPDNQVSIDMNDPGTSLQRIHVKLYAQARLSDGRLCCIGKPRQLVSVYVDFESIKGGRSGQEAVSAQEAE